MAERLHTSADVPDFDTYPGEPLLAEPVTRKRASTTLEETARQVGASLGSAVVALRQMRELLKDVGDEAREVAAMRLTEAGNKARQVGERMSEVTEMVRNKGRDWTQTASDSAEELRRFAVDKAREIRSQVSTGYDRARWQANQTARDYPLHLVVVAGVAGFMLGVGLRIWRSNHEP